MRFASSAPLALLTLLSVFTGGLAGCSGGSDTNAPSSGSGGGSTSSSNVGGAGGEGSGGAGGEGGGGTACQPGETEFCYTGPAGTEIVGACKAGIATCAPDGSGFGPCMGQVTPGAESCATMLDDDCDGQVNEEGCACAPGEIGPCYSGPMGTIDVGNCHGGTQICNADGLGYGPCMGELTPAAETCATLDDEDCDGQVNEEGAACVCVPNTSAACYSGPQGTEDVGVCKPGMKTCNAEGTAYGPCAGEVTPALENCLTADDDNCNGLDDACGTLVWSKSFGDLVDQDGHDIAADAAGNIYVTGAFMGTIDLGGGPMMSTGSWDVYVAKYSSSGAHLWSKRFGNVSDQQGRGIAVDAAGNVYLTGHFVGAIDFGGGAFGSVGNRDIFIAKLSSDGDHIMSKRFGGILDDNSASIAVDGAGNIAIAGSFKSSGLDFGGGALTSAGNDDMFVAKLDAAWGHVFSKSYGDAVNQYLRDISFDAGGNVVFTGFHEGTVDLGAGPLTSKNTNDILIAKLSPDGSLLFGKSFNATGSDIGHSVAVDGAGNVYASGYLQGSADFGGGPLPTGGANDAFLVKLDPAGGHIWSKTFIGSGDQIGFGIAVDPAGNVVYTGRYLNQIDFGGGLLSSAGQNDIFLAKLDASGAHVWSKSFGDPVEQIGRAVAIDGAGAIALIGRFDGTADFGGGPHTSAGGSDGFIARFTP